MTIERPMFPPRPDERCQIIQFSQFAAAPKQGKEGGGLARFRAARAAKREKQAAALATTPEELTATCRNKYLRDARQDAWWKAEVIRQYWRAALDMDSAIAGVQRHDLPEGNNHPRHDDRLRLIANWRQALVQQLLTPAPDTRAVAWKKANLASGQHKYTDVKAERIERTIVDDVEFLTAHPTRTKRGHIMKRRRRSMRKRNRQRLVAHARRRLCR